VYRVIPNGEVRRSPGGTLAFEGEGYGSGVSFFLVYNEPGAGPDLHRHPYSETWIVRSGKALIAADGDEFEAGPATSQWSGPTPRTCSRTSARSGWTSSASTPRRR
jgi:mannose-6-phosphate isomerase-like protein (cupin superfamily)